MSEVKDVRSASGVESSTGKLDECKVFNLAHDVVAPEVRVDLIAQLAGEGEDEDEDGAVAGA